MTKHQRRLRELVTIAEDGSKFNNHRHAAALYVRNKLVAIGYNQLKSHPLQAKFGKSAEAIFIHAEIDAIKNALKRVALSDLQSATLYIARSHKGRMGLSKPCEGCARAIVHFEIPTVYWTEDEVNTD